MFRIKIILILSLCTFLFHPHFFSNLSAEDETESTWVSINSITTKNSDFTTGKKILFESSFRDPGKMDVYTIVWDFGDGTISTGTLTTAGDRYANPGRCTPYKNICYSMVKATNVYKTPGSYTVTFSVQNSEGVRHEVSDTIDVVEGSR